MPPTNALCTTRPEPEPEPEFEERGVFDEVIDPSTSASIGAGITGAVAGGILADSLVTAANVGLTGELLTDAGVVGAVLLGGGAVYAAQRPDEAGEAARFVGGSVANVTGAYAELAAVKAAPQNLVDSVTKSVKSTLDGAQASARAACAKWPLGTATILASLLAARSGREARPSPPIPRLPTPR